MASTKGFKRRASSSRPSIGCRSWWATGTMWTQGVSFRTSRITTGSMGGPRHTSTGYSKARKRGTCQWSGRQNSSCPSISRLRKLLEFPFQGRCCCRPTTRSNPESEISQHLDRLVHAFHRDHFDPGDLSLQLIGLRHDGLLEAELGGFTQAILAARRGPHLARQADFAEDGDFSRDGPVRQ